MSNQVFERAQDPAMGSNPAKLLAGMGTAGHAVQFYESDDFLLETVIAFLKEGLEAGDRLLVVATGEHRGAILKGLWPSGVQSALNEGRMIVLDASETLARIMCGELPDPARIERLLGELVTQLSEGCEEPRIRVYGEMVNLLWRRGKARAAVRLEELWNEARKGRPIAILCSYAVGDGFAGSSAEHVSSVCSEHDLVLPTERFFRSQDRHSMLREISILQHRAHALDAEKTRRAELEKAVDAAMQALCRFEDELAEATQREKAVRARADASDAFEELFVGILGNELRRPLGAISSLARRMSASAPDADGAANGLREILQSTAHMERMLDQLVDVTRVRSRGGLSVPPMVTQDLVPIISRVVESTAGLSPDYKIVLRAPAACTARVDARRFEQLIDNLVGNAVVHGDPAWPVNVTVAEFAAEVSISVQNCGTPIPKVLLPILFSPFARGPRPEKGPAGLGLGLYLSELIVTALGGRIEVESNLGGTLFEVVLPRTAGDCG